MRKMRPEGALLLVAATGLIAVIFAVCTTCDARTQSKNKLVNSTYNWKKWAGGSHRKTLKSSTSTECDFLCESTSDSKNVTKHGDAKEDIQPNVDELFKKVRTSRQECEKKQSVSFYCERIRWSWWFVKKLQANSTKLSDYVELVRRSEDDFPNNDTQAFPVTKLEKLARGLLSKWGEPVDQLVFSQLRKYITSRDLKVTIPSIGTALQFGPSTHPSGETGRILFDPGFNLKMKLPFFRDELKFAVSTGPSFMAGLGIGMFMLMMRSMFSPIMMMMKAMVLSYFMRDMSPFDFLRVFGFGGSSNNEATEEVQQIEVYNPPTVNNPYDNMLGSNEPQHTAPSGGYVIQASQPQQHQVPPSPGFNVINLNVVKPTPPPRNQYIAPTKVNPILPFGTPSHQLNAPSYAVYQSPRNPNRPFILNSYSGSFAAPEGGSGLGGHDQSEPQSSPSSAAAEDAFNSINSHRPQESSANPSPKNIPDPHESGFQYVPSTGLQLEVENFDPFYSPLLSRIDSIFMHLNVASEGCRERVVCSIYKSPVKYAPYSNLLSAQLSKHQSELKRPASTSPKVLRYFKYMKAAKDGQGAADCLQLYPHCESDTDKLSNLPMVKTYQQLTELMGTESGQSG